MRGIYLVGNNKVKENAIALMNTIRLYDPDTPVFLIPFDDDHQAIAEELHQRHGVELFPDLEFVDRFTQKIGEIFDSGFLKLPNKMRKLVAWFGPLERFLYIDTDIIVFDRIADCMDYLDSYDFLCCDYNFRGGLTNIFSPVIREKNIFTETELKDVFNSGFWASKKGTISQEQMETLLRECANHREYFDFTYGTTDQPIMNYMVLKAIPRRLNLVNIQSYSAGSWGGSNKFREENGVLYDGDRPLKYLHWAGSPMRSGGPYRDLWERYRYLNEPKPAEAPSATSVQTPAREKRSWWGGLKGWVKKLIQG